MSCRAGLLLSRGLAGGCGGCLNEQSVSKSTRKRVKRDWELCVRLRTRGWVGAGARMAGWFACTSETSGTNSQSVRTFCHVWQSMVEGGWRAAWQVAAAPPEHGSGIARRALPARQARPGVSIGGAPCPACAALLRLLQTFEVAGWAPAAVARLLTAAAWPRAAAAALPSQAAAAPWPRAAPSSPPAAPASPAPGQCPGPAAHLHPRWSEGESLRTGTSLWRWSHMRDTQKAAPARLLASAVMTRAHAALQPPCACWLRRCCCLVGHRLPETSHRTAFAGVHGCLLADQQALVEPSGTGGRGSSAPEGVKRAHFGSRRRPATCPPQSPSPARRRICGA